MDSVMKGLMGHCPLPEFWGLELPLFAAVNKVLCFIP